MIYSLMYKNEYTGTNFSKVVMDVDGAEYEVGKFESTIGVTGISGLHLFLIIYPTQKDYKDSIPLSKNTMQTFGVKNLPKKHMMLKNDTIDIDMSELSKIFPNDGANICLTILTHELVKIDTLRVNIKSNFKPSTYFTFANLHWHDIERVVYTTDTKFIKIEEVKISPSAHIATLRPTATSYIIVNPEITTLGCTTSKSISIVSNHIRSLIYDTNIGWNRLEPLVLGVNSIGSFSISDESGFTNAKTALILGKISKKAKRVNYQCEEDNIEMDTPIAQAMIEFPNIRYSDTGGSFHQVDINESLENPPIVTTIGTSIITPTSFGLPIIAWVYEQRKQSSFKNSPYKKMYTDKDEKYLLKMCKNGGYREDYYTITQDLSFREYLVDCAENGDKQIQQYIDDIKKLITPKQHTLEDVGDGRCEFGVHLAVAKKYGLDEVKTIKDGEPYDVIDCKAKLTFLENLSVLLFDKSTQDAEFLLWMSYNTKYSSNYPKHSPQNEFYRNVMKNVNSKNS